MLFDHCFVCYDKDPVISYNSLFIISNVIKKFGGLDPTLVKKKWKRKKKTVLKGEGIRKQRKVRNIAKGIIATKKKGRKKYSEKGKNKDKKEGMKLIVKRDEKSRKEWKETGKR